MATASRPQEVKFYFDPICPWAWRTSLWMREVAQVRPVQVEWGFLSLDRANRAAGNPPRDVHQQSHLPFRVLALVRREQGNEAVDRLYLALGRARHERKQNLGEPGVVEQALVEAGLDPALLTAAQADSTTEQEIEEEHASIAATGAFGVPTLIIDGARPLYGPVIANVPEGEAAGEMWDRVTWFAEQPDFYELKRPR